MQPPTQLILGLRTEYLFIMSSSRNEEGGKKRKGKGTRDSKRRNQRTRGDYTSRVTTAGAGTPDDPSIFWYLGRPKKGAGELYEQMIRDAAVVTGLGVWYIRYLRPWPSRYLDSTYQLISAL
ncbi:uncharacterized protein CTRU02_215452 [Colletotrichum truncatum]|uniref:Uncharacterized protein n=1 Tax=Colletotrichum truncatum TaxID=5467 RepID=A0ACC3YCH1_COLTU